MEGWIVGIFIGIMLGIVLGTWFWKRRMNASYDSKSMPIKVQDAIRIWNHIYEEAGIKILITDAKGKILMVNKDAKELFGASSENNVPSEGQSPVAGTDPAAGKSSSAGNSTLVGQPVSNLVSCKGLIFDGSQQKQEERSVIRVYLDAKYITSANEIHPCILKKNDLSDASGTLRYSIYYIQESKGMEEVKSQEAGAQSQESEFTGREAGFKSQNAGIQLQDAGARGKDAGAKFQGATADLLGEIRNENIASAASDLAAILLDDVHLEEKPYDMGILLSDVLEQVRKKIHAPQVELVIEVEATIPAELYGDPFRIRQLLLQLLENAAKDTTKGTITFKADWDRRITGPSLYFHVMDTGVGLKKEELTHLDRLLASTSKESVRELSKMKGIGLGLAISKHLAKKMGGDVSVESEYGVGSVFHIRIQQELDDYRPLGAELVERLQLGEGVEKSTSDEERSIKSVETMENFKQVAETMEISKQAVENTESSIKTEENLEYSKPSAENLEKDKSHAQPWVLVVDDNRTNLIVAKAMFSGFGLMVDTTTDGKKAVEMVQKKQYACVFVDLVMPQMDGAAVARAIRSLGGTYQDLLLVALATKDQKGSWMNYKEAGMQDFLGKPLSAEDVDEILKRWEIGA
ncbi:MAG: response regulator [Lachnospiraceae bacterium]|nr:response regulator [Lachnospiraceae bacterium]